MKVIDSGMHTAAKQMEQDSLLLEGVDEPILRFYQFAPVAVTYGYFINPTDWLKTASKDSARRPTGGGLIFHEDDFSFTLALPVGHPIAELSTVQRYQLINTQLLKAIETLVPSCTLSLQQEKMDGTIAELCMANPTVYDLLNGPKKIAGAAQRKNRRACIHQCSLFLLEPTWERIALDLVDPEYIVPKLQACTGSLFQNRVPDGFRKMLQLLLHQKFCEIFSFCEKACTDSFEQDFF